MARIQAERSILPVRIITLRYTEPATLTLSNVVGFLGNVRGRTGATILGDPMQKSGSIRAVRMICECTVAESDANIKAVVFKGNSQVFDTGNISVSTTGVKQGGAEQKSGVDTFVQGDILNISFNPLPSEEGASTKDHVCLLELELDS